MYSMQYMTISPTSQMQPKQNPSSSQVQFCKTLLSQI
jgi:hypothetical protein